MSGSQRPQTDAGQQPADPNHEEAAGATGAILNAAQLRWVKISIIVMTAMFAIGIPLLIGRIIYLAQRGNTPSAAATTATVPAKLVDKAQLALPRGAALRSVSLSGGLLAVHFTEATGGDGIAILDLATGQMISRVDVQK